MRLELLQPYTTIETYTHQDGAIALTIKQGEESFLHLHLTPEEARKLGAELQACADAARDRG